MKLPYRCASVVGVALEQVAVCISTLLDATHSSWKINCGENINAMVVCSPRRFPSLNIFECLGETLCQGALLRQSLWEGLRSLFGGTSEISIGRMQSGPLSPKGQTDGTTEEPSESIVLRA